MVSCNGCITVCRHAFAIHCSCRVGRSWLLVKDQEMKSQKRIAWLRKYSTRYTHSLFHMTSGKQLVWSLGFPVFGHRWAPWKRKWRSNYVLSHHLIVITCLAYLDSEYEPQKCCVTERASGRFLYVVWHYWVARYAVGSRFNLTDMEGRIPEGSDTAPAKSDSFQCCFKCK